MSEDDDLEDDEATLATPHARVLQRYSTDNPYLNQVFQHRSFGQISAKAAELLEKVSPDADELLVFAVRTRHGAWKRGYLLLTTSGARWVQTLPNFDEDVYSFDWKIEYERISLTKGLLVTAEGHQFQASPGKAKAFRELFYKVAQAVQWEAAKASAPAPSETSSQSGDLATQLRELSELREQGALSEDEFIAAKDRLLGG